MRVVTETTLLIILLTNTTNIVKKSDLKKALQSHTDTYNEGEIDIENRE